MVNARFMLAPYLLSSQMFMLAVFCLGLVLLPLQPQWADYAFLPQLYATILACALITHPGILGRFLSPERLQRLPGIEHIRDFSLYVLLHLTLGVFAQNYVQVVYAMSASIPYQDALLRSWDLALGLDWLTYLEWVHSHPFLVNIYKIFYFSLSDIAIATMLFLFLTRQKYQLVQFTHVFWISSFICTTIGTFFPAVGASAHLVSDLAKYPLFIDNMGLAFLPTLESLRDMSQAVVIEPDRMNGIVSFPSFHTAGAIAIACALNRSKLRLLGWCYAVVVIASTPIYGAHYFADLIAGGLIAAVVYVMVDRILARRWQRFFPGQDMSPSPGHSLGGRVLAYVRCMPIYRPLTARPVGQCKT
jgi:membrane-associated phospholipid phosphatase